jgi:hypothetical protein
MRARCGAKFLVGVAIMQVCLSGCASVPYATEGGVPPVYLLSRDRVLQYTRPMNWLDATSDSAALPHIIWLVRNDYTAAIAVNEVFIDAETRRSILNDGLGRLAYLNMSLAMGDRGGNILEQPRPFRIDGTRCTRCRHW